MNNDNSITNFSFLGIGRIVTIGFQALFYIILASFIDPETYREQLLAKNQMNNSSIQFLF